MNCACCDYGALSVVALLNAKLPQWLSLTRCPPSIFCDNIPPHSSYFRTDWQPSIAQRVCVMTKPRGSDEVIASNMVVSTPDASQCTACVLQVSRVAGHMLQLLL